MFWFAESWLKPRISNNLVKINGYYLLRNDRILSMGGGVAVYVNNLFKSTILSISANESSNEPEYIIVKLTLPSNDSILLASVYRRPKGILLNKFINDFCKYYPNENNVIIMGDLNCDLRSTNFEAIYIRDIVDTLALKVQPSQPTHHTASSDTWIDLFIVDNLTKIAAYFKSSSPFIAGHDLISVQYNLKGSLVTKHKCYRRNYSRVDETESNDLARVDVQRLCEIFSSSKPNCDVDNILFKLTTSIISPLDNLAPLESMKVATHKFRWVTSEIKNMIQHRNSLYK